MRKVSWRDLIELEMKVNDDSFGAVVHCTLSWHELDRKFDNDYGGTEGKPFTLWTEKRVYFPVCYDGAEWASSVPRDPCDEVSNHVGGGSMSEVKNAYLVDGSGDGEVQLWDDERIYAAIQAFFDDDCHDADDMFFVLMKPMRDEYENKVDGLLAYISLLEGESGVEFIDFIRED